MSLLLVVLFIGIFPSEGMLVLSVPVEQSEVFFVNRPITICSPPNLQSSGFVRRVKSATECSIECAKTGCSRYVHCPQTTVCATDKMIAGLPSPARCTCHTRLKICQNGGTLDSNNMCSCHLGYYGDICQHIIRDCTEGMALHSERYKGKAPWVKPTGAPYHFQVYCDREWDFTIIQDRPAWFTQTLFNRTWVEYEQGFGGLGYDHWLGLEKLHHLTAEGTHLLEIQVSVYRTWGQAFYCPFRVGGAETDYTLFLGNYSSPSGIGHLDDALLSVPGKNISGKPFSTWDHDTLGDGCPRDLRSGFWFDEGCTAGNLNGPYVTQDEFRANSLIVRMFWGGAFSSDPIESAVMRIKTVPEC